MSASFGRLLDSSRGRETNHSDYFSMFVSNVYLQNDTKCSSVNGNVLDDLLGLVVEVQVWVPGFDLTVDVDCLRHFVDQRD